MTGPEDTEDKGGLKSRLRTLINAPALTGAFYCFNSLTNIINKPSIPGTKDIIEIPKFMRLQHCIDTWQN